MTVRGSGTARSSPDRRCRTPRPGALAAAFSRSASAKTMLADLPPSSSVTRFTWSAHPAMICLPTSVEPVKHTLRTAGWVTNRWPTTEPRPGSTWNTPLRQPGVQRQFGDPQRGQRRHLGRLQHHRVPGRERRREPPGSDRHREVPRHDDADDAERLVERHVHPAGHRNLRADQPLRRAGVVVEHVSDVARLPAGVADGVTGVAYLQVGQFLDVRSRPALPSAAAVGPGRRARPGATSSNAPLERSIAASVSSSEVAARW